MTKVVNIPCRIMVAAEGDKPVILNRTTLLAFLNTSITSSANSILRLPLNSFFLRGLGRSLQNNKARFKISLQFIAFLMDKLVVLPQMIVWVFN